MPSGSDGLHFEATGPSVAQSSEHLSVKQSATAGPDHKLHEGECASNDVRAVTLALPGLNIQYPFSRLILAGAKTLEIRSYDLGHRGICSANEEHWLVETKSVDATKDALLDDIDVGHRPQQTQLVGTISFSGAYKYESTRFFSG